ncbi:porphobilinogen synthase [Streptomyces sp. CA-181903]|uniref:porphobilinogen synthase n=1 Tax=Streptomyces sp. CA-181903 TaxID=3240055 RepID=UPI003D8D1CEC
MRGRSPRRNGERAGPGHTPQPTPHRATEATTRSLSDEPHRPRRLRRTPALRDLVAGTGWHPAQLVLPLFVKEGIAEPAPIGAMPGVVQHTLPSLRKAAREAVAAGVGGLMVFAVPERKDAVGSAALDPDGILQRALREVADEVGDAAVVMSDVCLDEFTDHGHCGVLTPDGRVDNDATVERYAAMAVLHAEAGAHCVGLSGMMDGQVAAVRAALDGAGRQETAILAYTAKYTSAFYGPFRDAVECDLRGDRATYQMDPRNRTEALRELALDEAEGADLVMVKPALCYLDVLRAVADHARVPVAAYQVSGEYAMVEAAAARGWIDRERAIAETLTAVRRAGADVVLTYWAVEAARRMG